MPVIGLRDLVQSKKTQRDKDWLMLRRLVENDIARNRSTPSRGQALWWLKEARDPATLIALAADFPGDAQRAIRHRPLIRSAISGDGAQLAADLWHEEQLERTRDRAYWEPLKKEVEAMRLNRRK